MVSRENWGGTKSRQWGELKKGARVGQFSVTITDA